MLPFLFVYVIFYIHKVISTQWLYLCKVIHSEKKNQRVHHGRAGSKSQINNKFNHVLIL